MTQQGQHRRDTGVYTSVSRCQHQAVALMLCRATKRGPGLLQLDDDQQMLNKRRVMSSGFSSGGRATLSSAVSRQLSTITPLRGYVSLSLLVCSPHWSVFASAYPLHRCSTCLRAAGCIPVINFQLNSFVCELCRLKRSKLLSASNCSTVLSCFRKVVVDFCNRSNSSTHMRCFNGHYSRESVLTVQSVDRREICRAPLYDTSRSANSSQW